MSERIMLAVLSTIIPTHRPPTKGTRVCQFYQCGFYIPPSPPPATIAPYVTPPPPTSFPTHSLSTACGNSPDTPTNQKCYQAPSLFNMLPHISTPVHYFSNAKITQTNNTRNEGAPTGLTSLPPSLRMCGS